MPTGTKTAATPATAAIQEVEHVLLREVSETNLAERQLGNIASQRAADGNVRTFAQRMVEDHSAANEELMKLAAQKGVALPSALEPGHQKLRQRLSKLSGSAFDRTFMDAMVTDHSENVRPLTRLARTAEDEDVRAYAEKTLGQLNNIRWRPKTSAPACRSARARGRNQKQMRYVGCVFCWSAQ